ARSVRREPPPPCAKSSRSTATGQGGRTMQCVRPTNAHAARGAPRLSELRKHRAPPPGLRVLWSRWACGLSLALLCACGQTSNDELKREEQRDGSLLDAEDRDDAGPSQALSDAGSGDAQVDDASGPDGGGPPARMPAPPPDSVPRTFDPPIPGSFAGSVRGQIRARLMEPGPLYPPLPPTLPPGGREALCALRDKVLELPEDPFGTLGLAELGRNYYCDGGCFMCCLVPQNGSCHTSFDYDDDGDPPVNC